MKKWIQLPLGPLQTNCYCLYDDQNCIIFDPGGEPEKLIDWLEKEKLTPVAIFLTHAHFDHIGGVDTIREKYQVPLYIHKNEADWLGDSTLNGSRYFFQPQPVVVEEADHLIHEEGKWNSHLSALLF